MLKLIKIKIKQIQINEKNLAKIAKNLGIFLGALIFSLYFTLASKVEAVAKTEGAKIEIVEANDLVNTLAEEVISEPEIFELWTGRLYSSEFRAALCTKESGEVRGVLFLRTPAGEVDVYHFYGQENLMGLKLSHSSGHVFTGDRQEDGIAKGQIRLKNGLVLSLKAKRRPLDTVTADCAPTAEWD